MCTCFSAGMSFPMDSDIKGLKSDIKDLLYEFTRLKANVATEKNVEDKLVERFEENLRQCWKNNQSLSANIWE